MGIFHHPTIINSPLSIDCKLELRMIAGHKFWPASRSNLRGAIALCEDVASDLHRWLGIPTLALKHPTETNVPTWSVDRAIHERRLAQVAYCFRNTQTIYHFNIPGWTRIKLFGTSGNYKSRDEQLRVANMRACVKWQDVKVWDRLDDAGYDDLLASSVVVNEFFGAAANNGVVECMVRGTPLICNRLPAIEEYLGRDYPLYFTSLSDIPELLDRNRLVDASQMLLSRAAILPSFDEFARIVAEFTDNCEDSNVAA